MSKRKPVPAQSDLVASPPSPAASTNGGTLREYKMDGVEMRVARFDLLQAEFSDGDNAFKEEDLPDFQRIISPQERGWLLCRRLFGIGPVLPPVGASPDDMRTWSRPELMQALVLTPSHLGEELTRLRGLWSKRRTSPVAIEKPREELEFKAEGVIEEFGFGRLVLREEVEWFAGRLDQCRQMLKTHIGELTRHWLLNELSIHRLNNQIASASKQSTLAIAREDEIKEKALSALGQEAMKRAAEEVAGAEADRKGFELRENSLMKKRGDLMDTYNAQMKQINEIFPLAQGAGASVAMAGVFSAAAECHREWYRDGTNLLADGIFAANEIEILHRTSMQAPEPQYRMDVVYYLNVAKAFLHDPKWDGAFTLRTMKMLRAGYTAAALEVSKIEGGSPDLTRAGPDGEYPALAGGQPSLTA